MTILKTMSSDIGAGVDEALHVTGNGKFYTRANVNILR
jgi:hypothetical protein